MLRTALKPKFLALFALVLLIIGSFGWLGLWQLNVSQNTAQEEVLAEVEAAPEEHIDAVLPLHTEILGSHVGRRIVVTGHYDADHQVVVTGRRLGDQVGSWVLTPVVVDTTGARLAVVRGFVADGAAVPPPPEGEVTVHGVLQPQEGPPDAPEVMPEGHVQTVDVSNFVNIWPSEVYNGFLFAVQEQPPASGASAQLTPVPPPSVGGEGIDWRNFSYAIQWWIFAGFVVYVWWRMVRDEHQREQSLAAAVESGAAPDPDPDGEAGDDHPAQAPSAPTLTSPGGSTR